MKICIVGLGAIGGWFAAHLGQRVGSEVQLSGLARGATLEALRKHGLRMDSNGERVAVALKASSDPNELGAQDLIVLAVKHPSLAAVVPAVKAMLAPHTKVLVAMNGVPWWFFNGLGGALDGLHLEAVDPGGVVAAAIPSRHVIGCVVHAACAVPEPGLVRHVMGMGLIIGEPAGGVPEHITALAALLTRAGFNATVSERIQKDVWYKLWGNMTMNPISALTGATCDRILDDELVRGFVSAVMSEAALIGERIGCPVNQTPEERHQVTRKLGAFKTSMLQDLEAGRPLELDALVGSVHEIGRHLNMATPYTDAMLGLTRLMVQTRAPAAGTPLR